MGIFFAHSMASSFVSHSISYFEDLYGHPLEVMTVAETGSYIDH